MASDYFPTDSYDYVNEKNLRDTFDEFLENRPTWKYVDDKTKTLTMLTMKDLLDVAKQHGANWGVRQTGFFIKYALGLKGEYEKRIAVQNAQVAASAGHAR